MKRLFVLKKSIYIIFFMLNLSIISCGEEINSKYREVKLAQLKIISFNLENQEIDITSNLEIKFNSQVSRSSLYKGVSCKSGDKKAFIYLYKYSYDDGDLVKIIPFYPFIPYVKYTCTITQDVTNIYGEALDKEYKFSFKTNNQYFSKKTFNQNSYSYKNVYTFLQRRCSECHNKNHKLDFTKPKKELYKYLTENKNQETNKFYIIADDTENSYLINKLMGINFYGDKMPQNDLIPLYELEKIIGWIKTGAKYEKN